MFNMINLKMAGKDDTAEDDDKKSEMKLAQSEDSYSTRSEKIDEKLVAIETPEKLPISFHKLAANVMKNKYNLKQSQLREFSENFKKVRKR